MRMGMGIGGIGGGGRGMSESGGRGRIDSLQRWSCRGYILILSLSVLDWCEGMVYDLGDPL